MDRPDFDPRQQVDVCGRCQRWGMTFLRRMTTRSTVDWYGCSVCGHLVTRPRRNQPDGTDNVIGKTIER